MVKLALDVGRKRIGVAISDAAGILAHPHSTVQVYAVSQAVDDVAEIVQETRAETVYIGLPISDDGQPSEVAQFIQKFAAELAEAIAPLKPQFVDERYTTKLAHQQLHELGKSPSRNRHIVDQLAAVNILESALK
jgi:putative Holliday junction resolvase